MPHPAIKSISFTPTGATARELAAIRASRPVLAEVRIEKDEDGLHVFPVWQGVDRPQTGGVALPDTPSGRNLADRLKKAIEAGVAYRGLAIRQDNAGQTYVATDARVLGRTLNADLRRLGF